jgi:hypothetical protein
VRPNPVEPELSTPLLQEPHRPTRPPEQLPPETQIKSNQIGSNPNEHSRSTNKTQRIWRREETSVEPVVWTTTNADGAGGKQPRRVRRPRKGFLKSPRRKQHQLYRHQQNHHVPSNVDEPTRNDEGGLNTANRTPERRSETNTVEKKQWCEGRPCRTTTLLSYILKKLKIGLTGGEAVTQLERDQRKLRWWKPIYVWL